MIVDRRFLVPEDHEGRKRTQVDHGAGTMDLGRSEDIRQYHCRAGGMRYVVEFEYEVGPARTAQVQLIVEGQVQMTVRRCR